MAAIAVSFMPRNPNADRNTSPDAKRRMAYRAAVRMRIAGDIDREMPPLRMQAAVETIVEETDCSEPVAASAVRRALGIEVRPDAPTLPDGWMDVTPQFLETAPTPRDWYLRSLVWPTGSGLPAVQPKAKAVPVAPQSFERPKRRIVLE